MVSLSRLHMHRMDFDKLDHTHIHPIYCRSDSTLLEGKEEVMININDIFVQCRVCLYWLTLSVVSSSNQKI